MIISNSRKFIFVHIPKCGGTTVSNMLERFIRPQDITLNLNPHIGWDRYIDAYRDKYGLFKHSTAAEIAQAMGTKFFSEYTVFTFCRNPFARLYSAFNFTLQADARYRPNSERYKIIKDMNFDEFIKSPYVQDYKMIQTKPQNNWIKGSPVPVRAFKLENIDQSLPWLMKKYYGVVDLEPIRVKRLNYSTNPFDWTKISEESEEIIRSHYAVDFKQFGYSDRIDRNVKS
jgi:hypothetical protein